MCYSFMKFLTLQPKRLKQTFWFVFFRMMKEVIKFKLSKILRIVVPWSSNNSKSHSKYWKSNKGPTIKAFPNFDGWTSMNLKFLQEVSKKREESLFHKLIDIGTCSLHSIHQALKTSFENSTGNIKTYWKLVSKSCTTTQHDEKIVKVSRGQENICRKRASVRLDYWSMVK